MSGAAAVTLAIAMVAFSSAIFNAWLFRLRPQERGHLFLTLAALGALALTIPAAFLYESTGAQQARELRQLMVVGALPLAVGFLRFTQAFLGVDLRRWERAWTFYVTCFLVIGVLGQAAATPVQREIGWLGSSWIDVQVPRWVAIGSLGFGVLAVQLVMVYRRHLPPDLPARPAILAANAVWVVTILNDLAVGAGVIENVFLIGLGYDAFVVAFTAVLVRRFAIAMEQTEANAAALQRASRARARELRQRDVQLAHGERMATVGALAAGLSHEVNNPLAFVTSNLHQLRHLRKDPSAEADVEALFEETREGVERVRTIVQGLLRLARRSEERLEPLELREVVEQVLPVLRHELERRATVETDLGLAPTVRGDARLLGQVVLNLLLNAMQAIPDDRFGHIEIRTRASGNGALLEIRDDGRGLAGDARERAFEPFFTTRENGTGLGLVVSRRIIESHGGRIALDAEGDRSVASVWLPAADAAGLPIVGEEPSAGPTVVDDDPSAEGTGDGAPGYSNSRSSQNG